MQLIASTAGEDQEEVTKQKYKGCNNFLHDSISLFAIF